MAGRRPSLGHGDLATRPCARLLDCLTGSRVLGCDPPERPRPSFRDCSSTSRTTGRSLSGDHVSMAKRRIAAFGVDYLIIAAWIGLITAVGFGASAMVGIETGPVVSQTDKLRGHAMALLSLTLPVSLYFSIAESSQWQATVGKRALGLRVQTVAGARVGLGRSLARSAIKFLPWEIAHTAIWHVPGQPFVSMPAPINFLGYAVALAGAGVFAAAVFRGQGRTPYDFVAGTRVLEIRSDAPHPLART